MSLKSDLKSVAIAEPRGRGRTRASVFLVGMTVLITACAAREPSLDGARVTVSKKLDNGNVPVQTQLKNDGRDGGRSRSADRANDPHFRQAADSARRVIERGSPYAPSINNCFTCADLGFMSGSGELFGE